MSAQFGAGDGKRRHGFRSKAGKHLNGSDLNKSVPTHLNSSADTSERSARSEEQHPDLKTACRYI